MSCQPSRSSDTKQPFASSAVLINIYFQEHKENIFPCICVFDTTCSIALYFLTVFLTPARASSMKCWRRSRSVEWNGFPSRRAQVVFGHEFDVLFIYLFMFDWCLVCFQKIVSSFIHFPTGRCYLKEGSENDVASSCSDRLTASCSNPAASSNHRGSNDEAMRAWHIYTSKIWTADDSRIHSIS